MQSSSRSEKNAFQECIPRDSFGGCRDGPGCPGNPSRQPLKESLEMHSCKAFLESLQNGSVTSVKRALKSWGRGTIPTRLQGGGGGSKRRSGLIPPQLLAVVSVVTSPAAAASAGVARGDGHSVPVGRA